jgi:superoxide dismutase, Fe-Mn family
MPSTAASGASSLRFELPPLPYAEDALEPIISAETVRFHHGKHQKKYVDTMNQLLQQERGIRGGSLEDVVRASSGKLFNNAAQAWNHEFYWRSLSPKRTRPSAAMLRRIEEGFQTYERFVDTFAAAANGQFGSGWAWLVLKDGKLDVVATPNAETPMARGTPCLLAVDVWEHAYYIDYRNERDRHVSAVIGERLNWEFAESNLR